MPTNGGWRSLTQAILATTANITLSGEQTIDGVLTSLSRVLVKNQTLPAQNGPYTTGPGAWTRVVDGDTAAELGYSLMYILAGTVNAGSTFALPTATADITVGTTALNWVKVIYPNPVNVTQSTISGAPTTGTWKAGDTTRDAAGVLYVCTTAGTPGTWTSQGAVVPVGNLLDNGGHQIDQRRTSALARAPTVTGPPSCTGVDRWWANRRTNPGSYWTHGVVADVPPLVGTPNSMRVAFTAASAIPAADCYTVGQYITDMSRFNWGSASGRSLTLGFWVKAYVTGTFSVAMVGGAVSSYVQDVVITAANTWQFAKLTFPADPNNSATWNSPATINPKLTFCFGCSSTFRAGSTGAWQAGEFYGSAATTDFGAAISATGIQFAAIKFSEDTAGVFTPRPYSEELRVCQGEYFNTFPPGVTPAQNAGTSGAATFVQLVGAASNIVSRFTMPVPMRGISYVTTFNPSAANANARNVALSADCGAGSLFYGSASWSAYFDLLATTAAGSTTTNINSIHYEVGTGR